MANFEIEFDIEDLSDGELISENESRGYNVRAPFENNNDETGFLIESIKKQFTKCPLNKEELKELICNWIDENINKTIF
jgi:hypothetical protein